MKLKNKYTITLFHMAIFLAVLAAGGGILCGLFQLFKWSGISVGWVFLATFLGFLWNICHQGVKDSDDWL